jgi:amidase
MHAVPSIEEMVDTARTLGLSLEADEAALLHAHLAEKLAEMDEFVQLRIDERPPEVTFPERAPGHRPSAAEDPLNAWTWKCEIRGARSGLLAGKTVSFKDHTAVAGIPLAFGAAPLEHFIPQIDATVVTRALAAGATVTGKHVMDGLAGGFGLGTRGDFGRPLNPHDPAHYSGGSSSGSAVALAAGEVDISFGGDQGGSIRIPAAWCGVVGLKPTFGLVSHFGIGFGSDPCIDYTGPMAKRVEDVAAALQATAGYDGLDPRQARDIPESYDALTGLDGGVQGLRIGILEEGFEGPLQPEVRDAVMAAVAELEAAGAEVTKVSVPEHRTARLAQTAMSPEGSLGMFQVGFMGAFYRGYYPTSIITAVHRLNRLGASGTTARTKLMLLAGEYARRNFDGAVYAKGQNVRQTVIAAFDAALADVDVLVMPTCVTVAPRYEDPPADRVAAAELWVNMAKRPTASAVLNTQPYNYTGHPALAVPCGKAGRLPISMQLVGRRLDDALLLRVAYAYQQRVDWEELTGISG